MQLGTYVHVHIVQLRQFFFWLLERLPCNVFTLRGPRMIREQRSIRASACFHDDQTKTFMEGSVYFLEHFDKGREGPCLGGVYIWGSRNSMFIFILKYLYVSPMLSTHLCLLRNKEKVSSWSRKYSLGGKSLGYEFEHSQMLAHTHRVICEHFEEGFWYNVAVFYSINILLQRACISTTFTRQWPQKGLRCQ